MLDRRRIQFTCDFSNANANANPDTNSNTNANASANLPTKANGYITLGRADAKISGCGLRGKSVSAGASFVESVCRNLPASFRVSRASFDLTLSEEA